MPPIADRPISPKSLYTSTVIPLLLLGLAVATLYGSFLWNPVVFDDNYFFDGTVHAQYLDKIFSLDLRWLPYATLEWTRVLFGLDLIGFRLGNLALHLANAALLFLFLRRLFIVVLPSEDAGTGLYAEATSLSSAWLAFFGALIFALHPVAVYATGYLVQRSTLMATLFTLVMWRLVLEGIVRDSRWLLLASAAAYLLAVLSKEHAIMAPAVALCLVLLLRHPDGQLVRRIGPTLVLYGLTGAFVVYQIWTRHILGQAYELGGHDMLARLADIDTSLAYPLSVLTQCTLYFKYLLLWLVPDPAWMSVDMYENFATSLWAWPQIAGLIAFIAYGLIAIRLLLKRGRTGLLGFALLCPWLLFATELSTVRIQESFVLYRSYLWMPGLFAALPFLFQRLPGTRAATILTLIAVAFVPLSWNRLTTFSHPLLLWDDAAQLVKDKASRPGVERIYFNRGNAFARLKHYEEAIKDYSKSVDLNPKFAPGYDGRGSVYLQTGAYSMALSDYTKAIALDPQYARPYLGRGRVYEALGNPDAARHEYQAGCSRGDAQGCLKLKDLSSR